MFEVQSAHVFVRLPDKRDNHANRADGDLDHRDLFQLHEPRIQVPGAGQQHLILQPAPSAAGQKRLGVLEVFVAGDDWSGDIARFD